MNAQTLLAGALVLNALLGFGYRVYRLTRGGPIADVAGQAVLGVVLLGIAAATVAGTSWAPWVALAYAVLFAFVVMPVWVLGVLLPQRPGAPDYAFTGIYWLTLFVAGGAALAA